MRFKFKIPLLLAMLAVGVFGVSAASATASEFLAAVYPVTVVASATNSQGFKIAGATSVCMGAEFEGTAGAASETLLVHPEYFECQVNLGGTHAATVTTTGCNYVFHAALSLAAGGTVDIECESGKEIIVHVSGLECEIKVPGKGSKPGSEPPYPNQGLGTIEYMNETNGTISVKANVTGITWSTTCALAETSGTNGEYREGILGQAALGTGPATALAKGFNSTGGTDAIMVE